MNIVLLGATGKTGTLVLEQALAAGHRVTVLVRSPQRLPTNQPNLRIVSGDVTDADVVATALTGSEVLISTLGGTSSSLITDAITAIIRAAPGSSLQQVMLLSSFAVKRRQLTLPARLVTALLMRKVIADKTSAEALLRASQLPWIIVYAARLTNVAAGSGAHVITGNIGLRPSVGRADVASWLLSAVGTSISGEVTLCGGGQPNDQA